MCANNAGSTPLHWATLNKHLSTMKKLIQYTDGPGALLINCKNAAGHSPLAEAELSEWEEGARWLVEQMPLEDEEKSGNTDAISSEDVRDIEVEIQDADGGIAKMSLSAPNGPLA